MSGPAAARWFLPDLLKAASAAPAGVSIPELPVQDLTDDSREVGPGALFVAVRGPVEDGHRFVGQAAARGAAAVLVEEEQGVPAGVVQIRVDSTRKLLGPLAQAFWGDPSKRLRLVGVTGTNGKSTVTALIRHLLESAGYPCGLIGTVSYRAGGRQYPSGNTTPGAVRLGELLSEMVKAKQVAAALEVSSHALEQGRTDGIRWTCGVFTNLNPEHLDYHRTLAAYRKVKLKLFEALPAGASAVINADDPSSRAFGQATKASVLTFGLNQRADFMALKWTVSWEGTACELKTPEGEFSLQTPLAGRHNVENLLAALAAVTSLKIPLSEILPAVRTFTGVPGRLERVDSGEGLPVWVDYAHTEVALRSVLTALKEMTRRKILVVFGCGGDRDRSKRPRMGEVAAALADRVIVTSDNPRSEDPGAIAQEIAEGLKAGPAPFEVVLDRREAIRLALTAVEEEWVVLIAGKGHEREQLVGPRRIPFDDREVVRQLLGLKTAAAR
ncbi:MAG: UDP-N-acetylmuramoyl-L-alanyl-D-glutamate--2,6-diaminopimelate ligase [Candidatus Omnitrophica bacterium]|nr:UDP-N-acetylmuramoyl-L-alanyl-D-glutamate--2,6-diaminopimelate ligase [Candidatus Omnitrophota bacterium]